VSHLDEGWDFQVFEVDGEWLFRFPKREESASRLKKEYRLLPDLSTWVSLPIPCHEWFSENLEGSNWPFAGYKKLPGIPADIVEAVDWPTVARQLGVFLAELHAYPVGRAEAAGVPRERNSLTRWRDQALAGLERIVDLGVSRSDLSSYLKSEAPRHSNDVPRLVHNDLWAEHVLIDQHTGCVSGIIDWGDAAIGDPTVDLGCIFAQYGEQGLRDVLTYYSGPLGRDVNRGARYLAACLAIRNITLGQDLARPQWIAAGQKALRWVFASPRAWSSGSLDRCL